jgi:predicted transcriptional regulator
MAVTQAELDDFHKFASKRIEAVPSEMTFDDLVMEWESLRDRAEINAAIREGLADVEAGRHRPARDAMEELRQKHGLSPI